MKRLALILTVAMSWSGLAPAREPGDAGGAQPARLADLVAEADLVALVRVLDTDYEYVRGFPAGGTAFLQVLLPYKVSRPLEDVIQVYEEGLHEGECYFDNPSVLEEGRRHLVFLRFSKEVKEQYNGLPSGCRLDVLVNDRNLYALRYPLSGIELADDFSAHAEPMAFRDAHAVVPDEDISPDERNDLLAAGFLERVDEGYRFSQGIDLTRFRELMGPEALTRDRTLK